MANSQYEYVKNFELDDRLLPNCWIVVRIDGKGFTKFSALHDFEKPNDERALNLMDAAAMAVMKEFSDIRIAFGESDEYSFVFHKGSKIYGRRASKLVSLVASCFTGNYVRLWPEYLPDKKMNAIPMFDGRAVCYPTDRNLRDYLSWRQADTHINCQYNTCYWALVKSGKKPTEAQTILKGTQTDFKNELLFNTFGINYNNLPQQFRKGSVIIHSPKTIEKVKDDGTLIERKVMRLQIFHEDIIRDAFWNNNPHLLK